MRRVAEGVDPYRDRKNSIAFSVAVRILFYLRREIRETNFLKLVGVDVLGDQQKQSNFRKQTVSPAAFFTHEKRRSPAENQEKPRLLKKSQKFFKNNLHFSKNMIYYT